MGTPKFSLLASGLAICVASSWVQAQPATDVPPPQLEPLEEGEAPAVTIRSGKEANQITESRDKDGKVREVKVTSGGSTYYLRPNEPAGSAMRGDGQSNVNRPAQWRVMEFPTPQQQPELREEEQPVEAPPPPMPESR